MEQKSGYRPHQDGSRPSWQEVYQQNPVESMPWYNPELDADLAAALDARGLSSGTFLDLGTGPGTQAIELAKRGFSVTGADIAEAAIAQARARSADVRWIQDDILHTALDETFDFVFDRGCFHVFEPELRPTYVASLTRIVKPGGTVFLKCFSTAQEPRPDGGGPKRFSRQDIHDIFGAAFEVQSIHDTVYQGTLDPFPKALFAVLTRKA